MNNDLVSIIVPVYNSEKYLRQCVDSIINQTYQNLDIILVDDGSTDTSGAICDEYAKNDNRVHVIHKKNTGNGDARNTGLRNIRGQWVVMSDNDDILHHRQIEVLLAIACDKDADISVGGYRSFKIDELPQDDEIPNNFLESAEILSDRHLYDDDFIHKRSMILAVPWGKICKKEVYKDIQYPAKSKHDDAWSTWKLYENSQRAVFTPLILHFWRDDPNSFGRRKFDASHFDGLDAYGEQLEYFIRNKKQRYVEIVYAEYLETFFWCYNRMKEEQMNLYELLPYWRYLKLHMKDVRISSTISVTQWIKYRYLMFFKIPKIIKEGI